MDRERLWEEFADLSPEAQQLVADFIAFLRTRQQASAPAKKGKTLPPLRDEPFIGMWQDRSDMADSSAWVRAMRKREWGERPDASDDH